MIIVTTNDIPGYRIDAVLGEVMGMTVRSANIGANFIAGFRSMGGGEIHEFTKIVYESRNEVMNRMWADAQQRGANAIVGMRFDTGEIGQSFTEICAYGTAVVVRPIPSGEDGSTVQSAQQAAQSGTRPAAPQETRPDRQPPPPPQQSAQPPAPQPQQSAQQVPQPQQSAQQVPQPQQSAQPQPSAGPVEPPPSAPGPQPVPGQHGYQPQVPPPTGYPGQQQPAQQQPAQQPPSQQQWAPQDQQPGGYQQAPWEQQPPRHG
ncbi:hypothetical protein GCM10011575_44370 [Microlunatus endophyticus]|uniref:UPF0145 protein GCM10011575_44370 n=1 Tax=Microlunatus endophyticus TaxID=1716077 RepID=A0A917W9H1_9ACTN|nr:YbjQ family protein [Microlunatus endophyticus]GGL81191.1 hypothetical protein GCM10011575_44370 [Microlunatus endophyticus]